MILADRVIKKQFPRKLDKRILRSRQLLRQALMVLIKEKEFDSISVEEITTRAGLGRATFYLHYKNKDDLLIEEFREIAADRVQVLSKLPISIWDLNLNNSDLFKESSTVMPLLLIFEHASQNTGLYRLLLKSKNSQYISFQLQQIIIQSIHEIINSKVENQQINARMDFPIELLAAYFSGAFMSSINWWLDQPMPPDPHEMAQLFQQLFFMGAISVWNKLPAK